MNELDLLENDNEASRFWCRLLGLFYEDLIVPIFEKEGYEILAGKRNAKGKVTRPKVYIGGKTKPTTFDFLLKKVDQFFLVEAKCWPLFHPTFGEKVENAIREGKTKQRFGINMLLFRPNIKVFYDKNAFVENPRRVLLFWKTKTGEKVVSEDDVRIEVWPIYNLFVEMKTIKDNAFKRDYYKVLKKYKSYTAELFKLF